MGDSTHFFRRISGMLVGIQIIDIVFPVVLHVPRPGHHVLETDALFKPVTGQLPPGEYLDARWRHGLILDRLCAWAVMAQIAPHEISD